MIEGPTIAFGTPLQIGATFSMPVTLSAQAPGDISIPFTLGGTAGVSYLRKMLDVVLFPELFALRTEL